MDYCSIKFARSRLVIFIIVGCIFRETFATGCTDNQSCTDLCGYAGAGTCVEQKYCKCANCPMRSLVELATLPKICTLDPSCVCPNAIGSNKVYTGHRCVHSTGPVCICFCLPLPTVETLPDTVKQIMGCPFPKSNGSTTTPNSTAQSSTIA